MTGDLFDFVVARIAEDEAIARAAGGDAWNPRVIDPRRPESQVAISRAADDAPAHRSDVALQVARENAVHIARHSPARTLDECTAKRLMIANAEFRTGIQADAVLTYLALPYAGHPDYQEQWRP